MKESFTENAFYFWIVCGVSAARYRRAEYVCVIAVVISELEFRDVQREVFTAHFVETAHDAALQKRPETTDGLGMDRTVDVLPGAMPHNVMLFQFAISGVIIGRDKADFFGNGFTDEAIQCFCIGILDDASHDITPALDGADNSVLAFTAVPGVRLSQCRFLFSPPM
jgi:hypothetical protein